MSSSTIQEPTSNKNLIRFLLLFIFIGVSISCLLVYLTNIGLFEKWVLIATVPENTTEIVLDSPDSVYIRTSEDKIFSCYWKNSNECWIPDVITNDLPAKTCNKQTIAFSPVVNAPKNATYCTTMEGAYGAEMGYTATYIIDQRNNLWKWELISSAADLFFAPLIIGAGGLAGMLLASIIWVIKKSCQNKHSHSENSLFPKDQLVLHFIPWLCLFLMLAIWILQSNWPFHSANSAMDPMYTAAAETVTVKMTELAQKLPLVVVTPNAGGLRYTFYQNICDAEWGSSSLYKMPCNEDPDLSGYAASRISNPQMGGNTMRGDGLWVRITPRHRFIEGEYPMMEIQEGDHFRTTAGCLDESPACDIIFEISYTTLDKKSFLLGSWSPKIVGKVETIDLDLSKLAGQKVRFSLSTYDFKINSSSQYPEYPVWFMPRIEK